MTTAAQVATLTAILLQHLKDAGQSNDTIATSFLSSTMDDVETSNHTVGFEKLMWYKEEKGERLMVGTHIDDFMIGGTTQTCH